MKHLNVLILLLFPVGMWAEIHLPDSVWTVHQKDGHHHAEQNEIWLSADRPGMGTGSEVLDRGYIQWETGFECAHSLGAHLIGLPDALFRFGLHKRAELRLGYSGTLLVNDKPNTDPATLGEQTYMPSWLMVGSKILLWDHHGGSLDWKWVPRTALMANIGVPLTKAMADFMPVAGTIDLLFEHEVLEWLSIGYDVGAHWVDWAPAPDVFASLCINFEPTDHLGLFIESYNIFDPDFQDEHGRYYTHCDISMDFGLTYAVHPRVQLDAHVGFNLYDTEPLLSGPKNYVFAGLGVTWLIWHPNK